MARTARWLGMGLGLAAGGYAALVGVAWLRYGHHRRLAAGQPEGLLDRFMPEYEVVERHHLHVAAPAATTLAAALDTSLQESPIIRGIIRARELALGATPVAGSRPAGLLEEVTTLGWGVLADEPGAAMVFGAVTQPWQAAVVFRALPPDTFAAFDEPGYVKIAWTLQVRPLGEHHCLFETETRAIATDSEARRKFRWYWARFSPGIVVIRWAAIWMTKTEAERQARQATPTRSGTSHGAFRHT